MNYQNLMWCRKPINILNKYSIFTGKKLSEEAKKKISNSNKGRQVPDALRKQISEKLKGRVFSEEHKQKISSALKNKSRTDEQKKNQAKVMSKLWWVQLKKDTEEIVNIFNNGVEIINELGFKPGNISTSIKNNWLAYNYRWTQYKKDEISKEEIYSLYGQSI